MCISFMIAFKGYKHVSNLNSAHIKTSFEPISDANTSILILGSLPGDKSIELGEYYGHSRNRYWSVIASITNNELPLTYPEKKALLLKTGIGVWDVAHSANRKGSLDGAIHDEEPNDIDGFIARHKKLKVIGFNGLKSQALFEKYFDKRYGIEHISLPSTSPANARIDIDRLCNQWRQLLIK